MPRPPILPPPTRHRTTPPRRRLLCRETRQGDARRWCVGRRGDPEARGGGAEAAKGVQELPDMSEARRCCCARGAELVEARGLRAPRAQLSLVLRHRELGDGSVQVFKGESRAAKIEKGLSKEDKAQKLALKHWLEAIDPRHRYSHNLHYYYDCSLLAPQQEQAAFLLPA